MELDRHLTTKESVATLCLSAHRPIRLQTQFLPPCPLSPLTSYVLRAVLALKVSSLRGTQKQQEAS